MAKARKVLDWKTQLNLAIDSKVATEKRGARNSADAEACSMCGDYCAVKIVGQYLKKPAMSCND
jgi:phosphomethylpyrimidine synthase